MTLSDSSGFVYDPEGIDAEKLEYIMDLKQVRRGAHWGVRRGVQTPPPFTKEGHGALVATLPYPVRPRMN